MTDLVPFSTFAAGALGLAVTIVLLRKRPAWGTTMARAALALKVSLVAFAAPCVAYLSLSGDPDVWEFYRAHAWAGALILVILGIFATSAALARSFQGTAARKVS